MHWMLFLPLNHCLQGIVLLSISKAEFERAELMTIPGEDNLHYKYKDPIFTDP